MAKTSSDTLTKKRNERNLEARPVGHENEKDETISSENHEEEGDESVSKKKKRKRKTFEPDGCYSWVVLVSSFMANLIADGCLYSFGVLYVELLNYFKESKSKTAWVGSLFMSIPFVAGPLASAFTNRFGCRKTTIIGALLAALGFCLSSITNSIGQLCITLGIIAGVGLSMIDVGANVVVAYYFEKRRSFATSTAAAGSGIGTFVFAMLTEWLMELYTWQGAVFVIGGIMLNIVVCGALFMPLDESSLDKNEEIEENLQPVECDEQQNCSELDSQIVKPKGILSKIHNFLRNTVLDDAICQSLGFIYYATSSFLLYMWYDIPYIYLPDKSIEMGIKESIGPFLVSILGISSTVGQMIIGYLGDKPKVDTFFLYSSLTAVAGLVTMLVPAMEDYTGLAVCSGAYGIFISANYALSTILIVDLVGLNKLTSGYGLLLFIQGVANLIGPPIAGWICDVTSSYDGTFYTSGAGILLSGIMLFARPWLKRCAPERYYGSEVNKALTDDKQAEQHHLMNHHQDLEIGLTKPEMHVLHSNLDVTKTAVEKPPLVIHEEGNNVTV